MQTAGVLLVRQQHTIAWSEAQSLRDRVHTTGGTRCQRELTQVAAKESRCECACVFDQRCARVAAVVRDRVRFERLPSALRRVERCAAARTDRAGVEIRELLGKKELVRRRRLFRNWQFARQKSEHGATGNGVQELPSIG